MNLTELMRAYETYLRHERRVAAHTTSGYLQDLRLAMVEIAHSLEKPVDRVELAELTRDRLQAHLAGMTDYAPASVQRRGAALRSLFKYAVARDFVGKDPTTDLILPRVKRRRLPRILTQEEIDTLVEAPVRLTPEEQRGVIHLRDAAVLEIFAATGIRVSEMAGLDLASVLQRKKDGRRYAILRVIGKGDKERLVGLPDGRALDALDRYLAHRHEIAGGDSTALFTGWHGERLTRRGILLLVKKWGRMCGYTVWPHLLRHTFATEIVAESGEGLRGAQEALGHENPVTTSRYAQMDEQRLLKTASLHHRTYAHPRQLLGRALVLLGEAGRLVVRRLAPMSHDPTVMLGAGRQLAQRVLPRASGAWDAVRRVL